VELHLTREEFARLTAAPSAVDELGAEGGGLIVLTGSGRSQPPVEVPPLLPAVVVAAAGPTPDPGAGGADVVADGDDVDLLRTAVGHNPQAATALAVLLRGADTRSAAEGLHAESAVYGVLQAGSEFARWRGAHPIRNRATVGGPPVVVHRDGSRLELVLSRPAVRNALDASMRDALAAALLAALDDEAVHVELRGEGGSFCSGGDLDEFGTRPDPATAHLVRLARSPGWLLHQLAARTHVVVHGPCRGSGVELPAFAGRVTAHPDATFALPEVAMGLIPGAGGTVSLVRRIGRHHTARLALTGRVIDAPTARAWGLVDEVHAG
jgi:hypothetical protein